MPTAESPVAHCDLEQFGFEARAWNWKSVPETTPACLKVGHKWCFLIEAQFLPPGGRRREVISVPMIMTAMNLSSTDVFRRSHLFGLCLLPANSPSEIFHPGFPSSSCQLAIFIWVFTFSMREQTTPLVTQSQKWRGVCNTRRASRILRCNKFGFVESLLSYMFKSSSQVKCSGLAKYSSVSGFRKTNPVGHHSLTHSANCITDSKLPWKEAVSKDYLRVVRSTQRALISRLKTSGEEMTLAWKNRKDTDFGNSALLLYFVH